MMGMDIELHDALQRIRFEHPEIRSVMITSAKPPVFLFRCEHLDVGAVVACVESELL
jgi:hypothetical protein